MFPLKESFCVNCSTCIQSILAWYWGLETQLTFFEVNVHMSEVVEHWGWLVEVMLINCAKRRKYSIRLVHLHNLYLSPKNCSVKVIFYEPLKSLCPGETNLYIKLLKLWHSMWSCDCPLIGKRLSWLSSTGIKKNQLLSCVLIIIQNHRLQNSTFCFSFFTVTCGFF